MNYHRSFSLDEIGEAAAQLITRFPDQRIFAFHGDLGAGKTTFIKSLCEVLGVKHDMTSPSFGLVNVYDSELGPLYHFDLYRIGSEVELFDIGVDEYLDSAAYCFLEWPDIAENLLHSYPVIHVSLFELPNGHRQMEVTCNGSCS